jgi:uncharacterized membrane protein YtjA (UPF0391 family)
MEHGSKSAACCMRVETCDVRRMPDVCPRNRHFFARVKESFAFSQKCGFRARRNTREPVLRLSQSLRKQEVSIAACSWGRGGRKEDDMLRWALAFFVIAVIAAIFGFAGIAVAAAGIAKLLFFVFLVLFLLTLLGGLVRRA